MNSVYSIPVIATVTSARDMTDAIEAYRLHQQLQERLRELAAAEHGYTPDQRFTARERKERRP